MEFIDKLQVSLLSWLISGYKVDRGDLSYFNFFELWQSRGFHITPNHFYQPIPDTSRLDSSLFRKKSKLVGMEMKEDQQLKLLKRFATYKKEFLNLRIISEGIDDQKDPNYYFGNGAFDNLDAPVYHCMIREFAPRRIIEVGSGWSTKVAAQAAALTKRTRLECIEPYPQPVLTQVLSDKGKIIKKEVQNIPLEHFTSLRKNDFLFIDSSHTVKIGGDVNYLLLEVIPRLRQGVIVHLHDIFFPYDYPESWVKQEYRFWAEQYLLHAFLLFNNSFEVLFSVSYMASRHKSKLRKVFPNSPDTFGVSLWLRRIR